MPLPTSSGNIVDKVRSVTIISAASDGAHLHVVYAYAIALIASKEIEKVRIIFTCEWSWPLWQKSSYRDYMASLKDSFMRQVAIFPGKQELLGKIDERLEIVMAPRPEEMVGFLGDAVIRFEGPAAFKTTYLFGRAIHKLRPVVTASFSSHVAAPRNSDLLLVRTKAASHEQLRYVPPTSISYPVCPPTPTHRPDELIVTVYSQGRIKSGLKALGENEWSAIEKFFIRRPRAKWLLVGASNPADARLAIPPNFEKTIGKNIEILPFSDLDEIYKKSLAFLAFPRMFGGGGAALMALACAVPVLAAADFKSDIANFVGEEFHVRDFVHAIELIEHWLGHNDDRYHFAVQQQQACFAERMDVEARGRALLSILNRALSSRRLLATSLA